MARTRFPVKLSGEAAILMIDGLLAGRSELDQIMRMRALLSCWQLDQTWAEEAEAGWEVGRGKEAAEKGAARERTCC
ncbi:hypothetical protein VSDG_03886 [Cytospora chrysosperma]|uniref:Uncharacterized protein n=1 Tax=Cytospora chrysosperma TaxID=252740 RepID=A0A423W7A5_CYTCH|nr:hypothetical protein VSDG_03886 [Valsa sordida]